MENNRAIYPCICTLSIVIFGNILMRIFKTKNKNCPSGCLSFQPEEYFLSVLLTFHINFRVWSYCSWTVTLMIFFFFFVTIRATVPQLWPFLVVKLFFMDNKQPLGQFLFLVLNILLMICRCICNMLGMVTIDCIIGVCCHI
jgi:hypothetical protein